MVVGIMVGSGIFRTPGLVAAYLGRPSLTFVAWILGGIVALLGALCFAELSTRHPAAGGKYVYVREAFGPRAGFVVGWGEALATYPVAIAAIAVVAGEYVERLAGLAPGSARWAGVGLAALFTGVNLAGVASGRWVQNLATGAKVLVLAGVAALAFAAGDGAGWRSTLPAAPTGIATLAALALAFQAVVWTYYGYLDVAKIAEEVVDPDRTLPRVLLGGIAIVTALYLVLNAAFFQVLPIERIAGTVIIVIDGFTVLSLFRLRARRPSAPFLVPLFPLVPLLFVGVYAALFVGTAWAARGTVLAAVAVLGSAYGVSWMVSRPRA